MRMKYLTFSRSIIWKPFNWFFLKASSLYTLDVKEFEKIQNLLVAVTDNSPPKGVNHHRKVLNKNVFMEIAHEDATFLKMNIWMYFRECAYKFIKSFFIKYL